MLVLDTTILIDSIREKSTAIRKIIELEEAGETLCISEINALELYRGAYFPKKSDKKIQSVKKLIDAFAILPINNDTYEWFGSLSAELRSRGESINDFDELIAAIAMSNEAAIVSNDAHFKRIPGLSVILY
jgi:predicted nucleic acid-binding protein